ncbi:disulfide bond formation protein DsbB [Asticcacaulis biprosthecium C19]|uniref:Disulfide bond formation protein DsbB n=1 Tax=Asticcacaulis biprosthecium C19 TaxID=715226 RepID=F4QTW5_9CAUL|nr:disulfide bond formation protein B [Asticcacaulis biprosthecium]EGF89265.1 disulfide bond formation protein DsbB [Asticcacaulis biprosthecium C19]
MSLTPKPSTDVGAKLRLAFSRWWSITALVISLAMLATAWGFQLIGGLHPCHLCLKQRDIYWIAVGVSLVASVWAVFTGAKGPPRVFSFVLFAIFATGFAISLFHAGVEQTWWPGPQTCSAESGELSPDIMMGFITGTASKAPQCGVIVWELWGLTMAGYNTIASGILAILSLIASLRFRRKKKH